MINGGPPLIIRKQEGKIMMMKPKNYTKMRGKKPKGLKTKLSGRT